MTEKPAHHRVDVIRIEAVLPHGNADKLEIIPVGGYQAISAKGQFKIGDLAYYIPPDSVVPDAPAYAFLWKNETFEGGTPEKKRRIAARRLRGEWSEGLLMPVPAGGWFAKGGELVAIKEGDDVSDLFGITHWNPPEPEERDNNANRPETRPYRITTLRGLYHAILRFFRGERTENRKLDVPVYDVDNMKKFMNNFTEGEPVIVTEKIHGSNARFSFRPGGFLKKEKMWAGSRNLWKAENSTCAWRRALKDNPWIETWCRQFPGYTLYGEITPTQKGFNYGGSGNKIEFWVFDILNPNREWESWGDSTYSNIGLVPVLYEGPFNLEKIKTLVDGQSTVPGAQHIREGIVIRKLSDARGSRQLKLVSNAYLEKSVQ